MAFRKLLLIFALLGVTIIALKYYLDSQKPKLSSESPVKITVGNLEREYFYYLPAEHNKKLPVVIVLHGGGGPLGSAELMMERSGWKDKAESEDFLAVFPQATLERPDQPINLTDDFGDRSRNIRDWGDGSNRTAASRKEVDDVGFISAMIDDLDRRFDIDRNRVFATGFSNGATMSLKLGVELSDKISAVAPVAGALFTDKNTLTKPVSLLFIVGSEDRLKDSYVRVATRSAEILPQPTNYSQPTYYPQPKNFLELWKDGLECPDKSESLKAPDKITITRYGCKNNSEILSYRIEGQGHIYPGLSGLFSPNPGKAGNLINATDVVWDFFAKH